MNTRSFNKIVSVTTLALFLVTPSLAFAQCSGGSCSSGGGASQNTAGGLFGGGAGGIDPSMMMMLPLLMSGGRGGLGGGLGGGQGGAGQIGQFLTLAGLLSGNMGLAMAGLLTSMLGGLAGAGGQGATPQQGRVDEQYVAPGQAGPGGIAANNPYYTVPTPSPASTSPTPTPAPACSQSIFIVKDTTANPATTKPYPTTLTIPQADCALVINADTASHSLGGNSVAAQASQIFRFGTKKTYKMCIDASTTACTSVTVQ